MPQESVRQIRKLRRSVFFFGPFFWVSSNSTSPSLLKTGIFTYVPASFYMVLHYNAGINSIVNSSPPKIGASKATGS